MITRLIFLLSFFLMSQVFAKGENVDINSPVNGNEILPDNELVNCEGEISNARTFCSSAHDYCSHIEDCLQRRDTCLDRKDGDYNFEVTTADECAEVDQCMDRLRQVRNQRKRSCVYKYTDDALECSPDNPSFLEMMICVLEIKETGALGSSLDLKTHPMKSFLVDLWFLFGRQEG